MIHTPYFQESSREKVTRQERDGKVGQTARRLDKMLMRCRLK
jgi:hypothetical protein